MSLEIALEWLAAPGVASPALAETWCRLCVSVGGTPLTRFWSHRDRSVLEAVYVSAFPLARWAAENWWAIFEEGLPGLGAARGLDVDVPRQIPWLRRHDPALAREGMSYPDLCVFPVEGGMALCWAATRDSLPLPGRFIESGGAILGREEVAAALGGLVEATLRRLETSAEPEVEDLRALWGAVCRSRREEPTLCAWLAALGLDPYGSDLEGDLVEHLARLDLSLVEGTDLLRAARPEALDEELATARRVHRLLPEGNGVACRRPPIQVTACPLPYRAGYARAHAVRAHLGLAAAEPVGDLAGLVTALVGAPPRSRWIRADRRSSIDACVRCGQGLSVAGFAKRVPSERFLLARGLHHALFVNLPETPTRYLTRGHDWVQAASRAFAAELLAPAAALADRLEHHAREDDLAREFQVDPMVIAHQTENNGLG